MYFFLKQSGDLCWTTAHVKDVTPTQWPYQSESWNAANNDVNNAGKSQ